MALTCEITIGARTLLLYNVHLESRGSDELRMRQFSEILTDIGQHPAEMPVLMAGDFNFDLSWIRFFAPGRNGNGQFLHIARRAPDRSEKQAWEAGDDRLDADEGALAARHPAIHESIAASEHFPLSLELSLK